MWIVLALLTAFFTSLKDVVGKKLVKDTDVYIVAWAWPFFSLPFLYLLFPVYGVPEIGPMFWPSVAISTCILTIASIYFFKAIRSSDLSLSVPMLTFTPLFLLITSPLILGEFPKPLGLIGICFIFLGSYVLNFHDSKISYLAPFKSLLKEKGPRYMLVISLIYSIGANIDKIGVLNSSPFFWLVVVNTTVSIVLFIIMILKVNDVYKKIVNFWTKLLLIGLFSSIALIFQMNAIKLAIVPYVIAIKRMSVVLTSLFGFLIFKEKSFKERIIGVLIMVLGVIIISFFS